MNQRELSPFAQTFERLPATLPIFPLPNALLTPGGRLPLNIFEPRYLNMVEDVLKSDKLIGMVQPKPQPTNIRDAAHPKVFEIGCAGRITDYCETHDGRIEIVLSGLCRFAVKEELDSTNDYRLILADWSAFKQDYSAIIEPSPAIMASFTSVLKSFLEGQDMPADWDIFTKLSTNSLISSLINVLPIDTSDRQILLEADTLESRVRAFTAILAGSVSDSQTRH